MPAPKQAPTAVPTKLAEGVLVAPIGPRGRWAALRALRAGMSELRNTGSRPVLRFVLALAEDGRVVSGRSPEAVLFVLAYDR